MTSPTEYRRGDVVLVSLPFAADLRQAKIRPAVVIQNDVGNRFSPNLIVASISSQVPPKDYPTNLRLPAGAAGLDRESVVLGGMLMTVAKSQIGRRTGRLSEPQMRALDTCLRVSLAL